jgi:tetratricopeptide (TPR) repeat protein
MRKAKVQLLSVLILLLGCLVGVSNAQDVGDRVCVTANYPTKIKEKKVGQVFEGSIHTIIALSGEKWCALEGVNGWLPLEYVMNLGDAEKYYTDRIKGNEKDFAAYAHRGMIHRENEQLREAFRDLNNSLRINKENAATWSNRGVVYNELGDRNKAIEDISHAIKLNKRYARAFCNLGNVYYAAGAHDEAIKNYDKAIELAPKEAWFYINRASAKHDAGYIVKARDDYKKSIEINKRISDSHIGMSNIYLAEDDLEKALECAEKAVDIQPKNAVSLNQRGWVLYKLGKVEEAVYDLNRAINYAPRLQLAYNNRGVCKVAQGKFEEAIEDYDRCIKLSKAGPTPTTLSNRAVAYGGMQEYKKAMTDFEEALEKGESVPEVLNGLAWFLSVCPEDDYRDGKKALEYAKQAVKMSGDDDWNFVDTLAAAHAEAGEFEEATKLQRKAVELAPEKNKADYETRLKLYEAEKPYRSDVGKSS